MRATKKLVARDPGGEKHEKGGRISRGYFFAVFFRVTHDGLSERGTTRSLANLARYTQLSVLFYSLPLPEFPEFLVEWKAPEETLPER